MARGRRRFAKKSSSLPIIAVVFVSLAVGILLIGLLRQFGDSAPEPKPVAAPMPKITVDGKNAIDFKLDDPQIRYFYIDWQRGLNPAEKWSDIPHIARGVVAISTPALEAEDAFYVADLWSSKNGRAIAKPMSPNAFQELAHEVAMASYWAVNLEMSVVDLTNEIATDRIRNRSQKKTTKRTKIRRLNRFPQFSIPGAGN